MKPKVVTFIQNPEIDILFGNIGNTIPSKKEDFKPVKIINIDDQGKEQILENFYVKKPSSKSVKEFEILIREQILNSSFEVKKILKPSLVEVTIAVEIPKEKLFDIDVDNIAKTVLDSLIGYLYEDDCQVANLICKKDVHPLNKPGFFIAVTELKQGRKGLLGDLYLFSTQHS